MKTISLSFFLIVIASLCGAETKAPWLATEHNVAVPMRDGVVLRADVYRPDAPGEEPVLVLRTPCGKGDGKPGPYAKAGYIVVRQDARGRYTSDGKSESVYRPNTHEAADGYDTVEWVAKLPGLNGNVGTFGVSYNAFLQWRLAPLRPPSPALGRNEIEYADDSTAPRNIRVTHQWRESSENTPPAAPAEGRYTDGVLTWKPATDADGDAMVDHWVEIRGDPGMRWPLSCNLEQVTRSGASRYEPRPGSLSPGGTYSWHVRAKAKRGAWSAWSPTFQFVAPAAAENKTKKKPKTAASPTLPLNEIKAGLQVDTGKRGAPSRPALITASAGLRARRTIPPPFCQHFPARRGCAGG